MALFKKITASTRALANVEPTLEMKEHFAERTQRHIDLVNKYLEKMSEVCDYDFDDHDESKFQSPEYKPYLFVSWEYRCKDKDEEYEIPAEWQDKCHEATGHHVKTNKHHPEYWDDSIDGDPINEKDRNKPPETVTDATKMPPQYVLEMVADWCAMSEEMGSNTPKEWADENVDVRWKFSSDQKDLIYKTIDLIWE